MQFNHALEQLHLFWSWASPAQPGCAQHDPAGPFPTAAIPTTPLCCQYFDTAALDPSISAVPTAVLPHGACQAGAAAPMGARPQGTRSTLSWILLGPRPWRKLKLKPAAGRGGKQQPAQWCLCEPSPALAFLGDFPQPSSTQLLVTRNT